MTELLDVTVHCVTLCLETLKKQEEQINILQEMVLNQKKKIDILQKIIENK